MAGAIKHKAHIKKEGGIVKPELLDLLDANPQPYSPLPPLGPPNHVPWPQ